MTLVEWFLEYQDRTPRIKGVDYAGNLTRGDVEELSEWVKNG